MKHVFKRSQKAGLSPGTRYLNRLNSGEREGLALQEYLGALRRGS